MSARGWLALLGVAVSAACAAVAHAGEAPATAIPQPAPAPAAPGKAAPEATVGGDVQLEAPSVRDDREILAASERWLGLIDTGKLGAAWDGGAKPLKQAVTRNDWIKGIGDARKPFGKLASRNRERFARTHSIPGAPEGDYAVIQFTSTFENGKRALEEVTWMLDTDGGIWRVSGYYIR